MLEELFKKADESFEKSVAVLKKEMSRLRTGRANVALVEGVRVECYGSPMPLAQIASVNVSDPRTLTIKPWDKSLVAAIEKAIMAADVGITPNSDGTIIRLPVPPLTVERRKDLARQVKKMAENAKVAVRNVRRDFKSELDNAELPEDEQHRALKKLQDSTDAYVKKIDALCADKEKEIMEQ
jgi:ribosome recycling factor